MGYFQVHFSTTLNDLFQKIMWQKKNFFLQMQTCPCTILPPSFLIFQILPSLQRRYSKFTSPLLKREGGLNYDRYYIDYKHFVTKLTKSLVNNNIVTKENICVHSIRKLWLIHKEKQVNVNLTSTSTLCVYTTINISKASKLSKKAINYACFKVE